MDKSTKDKIQFFFLKKTLKNSTEVHKASQNNEYVNLHI